MSINVIIVDDELPARQYLREVLKLVFLDKVNIVAECDCVKDAVKVINKFNPELVFLDIQMPDENGFELFNYFKDRSFEVVFTTAHKNFAIEAIKMSAFDYLLKPIGIDELKQSVLKFESRRANLNVNDHFKVLLENLSATAYNEKKVIISTKTGFEVIFVNEIVYCKSEDSYTSFIIKNKTILSSKPFKEICETLSEPTFIRVHKSFLVNVNYIKRFNTAEYALELLGGFNIPVSDKSFNKKKLIDAISM